MSLPAKLKFIVVDDYLSMRGLIKDALRKLMPDCRIVEAENVEKAREVLENETKKGDPVQFILSDWEMPGETGFDFLKWIRANPNLKNLPFLMLTTISEKQKVLEAIQNGADNYMIKPFTINDLEARLLAICKKRSIT